MRRRISEWLRETWQIVTRPCVPVAGLLGILLAVLIGVGLWKYPQYRVAAESAALSARDRIELENQTRATWIQLVGWVVGLVVIYFTWRRLTATERTVEISQEGQITERFTRAIEQLGSDRLEIRLGGIYALERTARDSEKDHWTIMEVLTAFVRENARWRQEQATAQAAEAPPVRADIQAILTVIGRRQRTYRNGEELRLDLSETDLRRANCRRAHLEGAELRGARLDRADLQQAHLEDAWLRRVHLEGALLNAAHLENADLLFADLEFAELVEGHLEEAHLAGANLQQAKLVQAHLEGADLGGANLTRARLKVVDLKGARLAGAHLQQADLAQARLEGAYLGMGADLSGAVGLTREQIDQAITDATTKLPDYLASDEPSTPASASG
jgi:uncharacterized protein YjbI with pentapeptide repeats